jgi:hypothetical protein
MNKSTLISKLQFVSTKKVGLEMYFLYRKDTDAPIEILRANLEGSIAKSRLESVFVSKIKHQLLNQDEEGKSVSDKAEWMLKHINEVDDLKNTYYYFPSNRLKTKEESEDDFHIPDEFKEMVNLQGKEYNQFNLYEFGKHSLDHVFAYLIRLQIDNEQVILYKHKYSIDVLSRSTILKVLGVEKNHSTKFSLEQEPLLKLSEKIDFMLVDNHFIVINLQLLETKFGFNERYLKKGIESLSFIKKKNILTNTEVFDELVKKVSFSKKMMKVKSDNLVLKTPIQEMKDFLEKYKTKDGNHSLSRRIKFIPKSNKFEVTTKVGAEDFVKLLNDQFLWSLLTKRPFISDVQTEFIADDKAKSNSKGKVKQSKP